EQSYEYDGNGNRIRVTTTSGDQLAQHDAQDRLTTQGTTAYGYTAEGQRAFKAVGSDTTRYSFSALGDLLEVRLPDGLRVGYVVDAQGRRIGRTSDGVLTHGWLYDGDLTIVAELDPQGGVVSRFVYNEDTNVPGYMIKAGQTYRIVTDHLGSVRAVVNTASGAIAQRLDYDPFGRVTFNSSPGFQPFGYAGGVYDDVTGLTHFGVRDYDAEAGRWIAKDPLLFSGPDENLYAYAHNDPINYRDPAGTFAAAADVTVSMSEREKLRKDEWKKTQKKRLEVLKRVCKTFVKVVKRYADYHHVLFRVLGGLDDAGNLVWMPTRVHVAFHSYMSAVFKASGLAAPNRGKEFFDAALNNRATRTAVKNAMLEGARAFDRWCAGLSRGGGPGGVGGSTPLTDVLTEYFNNSKSWR
ncbi:MAG TPA: RHS repeat-associated core domain-containing protein, partial [Pyrinomonadaceae bacterium]|nr:RHS repeat-associated core domain-containing protein [Pyrinomonadaceae bacterium]